MKPPCDPAIPLLGVHPQKTAVQRDTCVPVFITAPFTTGRTRKPPSGPLTEERIKRVQLVCPGECYAAVKKKGLESVVVRWINLEPAIQCEVTQKEKD